ncbi:hypothetical protein J2S43_004648 [Catenuloplanes nepalensis]|uniref:Peptidase S8/S53 domain-containing protein n=1 Tax=Catenuloplanes nepalensis TaxID=587533 RepID=A0ABT9MXH3_9ACTN|nr:S8 family serine peptidase [Catenuloplanes nepalensis]MDP9796136.1 hypothetical protein [Catenuloplanes nepalensis]
MAHRSARRRTAVFLLLLSLLLAPAPAGAAAPEYRKYHVVTITADGDPETLAEIAAAVLGDSARMPELVALNSGRPQADGDAMSDPARLRTGWIIVLPWDAAGPGVEHGVLPEPDRRPGTSPEACPERGPDPAAPDGLPWAQLRFDLPGAWTRGRGGGSTVAVVDTGVDVTAPALAGRVRGGESSGNGGAPTVDCTGHGTAIAGIVAARAERADEFSGMAPEAVILPVRVPVAADGGADPRDAADAIRLAASAGAGVMVLTVPVDTAAGEVGTAIDEAVADGVAVVVPAGDRPAPQARPGLLRVGGVGADGTPAEAYPAGAVDVVAPGIGVTTIGTANRPALQGSGSDYAAAFAAGLLALVRAAAPALSAAEATQVLLDTADGATGTPDPVTGRGFVDPAAAVHAATVAQPAPPAGPPTGGASALGPVALAVAGVALLVVVAQVPLRLARRRR